MFEKMVTKADLRIGIVNRSKRVNPMWEWCVETAKMQNEQMPVRPSAAVMVRESVKAWAKERTSPQWVRDWSAVHDLCAANLQTQIAEYGPYIEAPSQDCCPECGEYLG